MANNRMYLECPCGERLLIGLFFNAWGAADTEHLSMFLLEHTYCEESEAGRDGENVSFRIRYEGGDA